MLNNGLMTYKNIFLSFINKGIISLLIISLMIIILPCSYLVFAFWSEMPIFMKVFWPIFLVVLIVGIIIVPFNGMIISRRGVIVFIPDYRIKVFKTSKLESIALNFIECENNKYATTIKLVYKGGKVFTKDYSKQFRNMRKKRLVMSIYTIRRIKVNKILDQLLNFPNCMITIIDKNGKIINQN